ncbi:MAG TPA: S66 peptidase family protein [Clostridia bacterium]|nr:S66 peptidase family protein [Clostridia bacterium]
MRYPRQPEKGKTIGICAPSSGVTGKFHNRLDKAIQNIEALGYKCLETASVRKNIRCVSASNTIRFEEFMSLYENPDVAVILPPWGGEFLMDMLPLIDFEHISQLPPKWICGYSDMTTLCFAITLCCDIATVHGSNLMNMGYKSIHPNDLFAFTIMNQQSTLQHSAANYGTFSSWGDIERDTYVLDKPSTWVSLQGDREASFKGRIIGGCMDVICKLIGTKFAPVDEFIEKYKEDGFIWTLESCEMNAADIFRTLWQMRECGWFRHCSGVLYGRPDGYADTRDFTLVDALRQTFCEINVPVLYNADIGHIPPQLQLVNGALGKVEYNNGKASVFQEFRL